VRARSYPLSEVTTSGEFARSSYSGFVTTLLRAALRGAEEKLSVDTVVLDLRELVDSFDALVVAAGRNDRQVRSIAEEIERVIDVALGVKPTHIEGWMDAQWIALDYGDVIVHVFDEETRDYYDLEHLWSAAPAYRSERSA
jgi:ribosome-associated protein